MELELVVVYPQCLLDNVTKTFILKSFKFFHEFLY